jgi:tRNA threonylcarbamoyladenosine biosynthesis protein TsaB
VTSSPVILSLDTSSKSTGLALHRGQNLLSTHQAELDEKRSERLWFEIESLLGSVNLKIHDVDLFAVCVGPGSFTGLRVGLAAVKGLAVAAQKPAVGVTSLEAFAFAAGPAPAVFSLVSSYKVDVYGQLFSFDDGGVPVAESAPIAATLSDALAEVPRGKPVLFAGSAAVANATTILEAGCEEPGWSVAPPVPCLAEQIGRLAFIRSSRGEVDTAESLRACYVRPAEAQIKLSKGLLGTKIKRVLGRVEPLGGQDRDKK